MKTGFTLMLDSPFSFILLLFFCSSCTGFLTKDFDKEIRFEREATARYRKAKARKILSVEHKLVGF